METRISSNSTLEYAHHAEDYLFGFLMFALIADFSTEFFGYKVFLLVHYSSFKT